MGAFCCQELFAAEQVGVAVDAKKGPAIRLCDIADSHAEPVDW
jgi:hypothetical protein